MFGKVNLLNKIKMEMNVADTDDDSGVNLFPNDPIPREINTLTMVSDQDYFGDYGELNLPQENNIKNEITIEEFDFTKAIQQYEVKMENLNVISSAPDTKDEFILKETTTTVTVNLINKNLPTVLSNESVKTIDCGNKRDVSKYKFQNTKVHTDEIPNNKQTFACTKCEKVFAHKGSLKSHIRIHTGEKLFTCTHCEKVFSSASHLNTHIRIHTGEQPFRCTHCEKVFNHKHNLNAHIRLHTGEKPFACTLCEKAFNHKQHLSTHIRIHTGEKPFRCTYCEKGFARKYSLKLHTNIHTAKKSINIDSLCNNICFGKECLDMGNQQ